MTRATLAYRFRWSLSAFLMISPFLTSPKAQAGIQYYPERKVWVLQAGEETYAFGVNERGELQAIYWGPRIARDADFHSAHSRPNVASFDLSTTTTPQEYPGWGAGLYNEPALKATYADGNRDVVLHFVQQHIDGDTLEIELKDIASALEVHLYYRVFADGWHSAEVVAHRQPNRPGHHPGERTISRLELAARGRLRLALHDRPLGSGVAAPLRAAADGDARHREPPRQYIAPGESMVCHRSAAANNGGERSGVVWSAGLEWQLAHYRGTNGHAAITGNGRIQSL